MDAISSLHSGHDSFYPESMGFGRIKTLCLTVTMTLISVLSAISFNGVLKRLQMVCVQPVVIHLKYNAQMLQ